MHQVGDQTRLYYDARSTNHQDPLYVSLRSLVCRALGNKVITFIKFNCRFKQHHPVVPVDKYRFKSRQTQQSNYVPSFTFLQHISFVPFDHKEVQKHKYINRKCAMEELSLLFK